VSALFFVLGFGLCPGVWHALMSQRRTAAIVIALMTTSFALVAVTVWALVAALAIWAGSLVHAGLRYRRLRGAIAWSPLWALGAVACWVAVSVALRVWVIEAFRIPSSSQYPTLQIGDHIFVNKLAPRLSAPRRGELIVFAYPCAPDRSYIERVIGLGGDTVEIRCGTVYVNGAAVARTLVEASARYEDYDEERRQAIPREVSRYRETQDGVTHDVFHDERLPERDRRRAQGADADAGADQGDFPGDQPPSCSSEFEGPEIRVGTVVATGTPTAGCRPFRHYVVPSGYLFVLGDNRENSNDSRYWGAVQIGNVTGRVVGVWLPPSRAGAVR
jgi:signal peptidase I